LSYGGSRRRGRLRGPRLAHQTFTLDRADNAPRMTETDPVLRRPERLLAIAAVLIVGAAALSTVTVDGMSNTSSTTVSTTPPASVPSPDALPRLEINPVPQILTPGPAAVFELPDTLAAPSPAAPAAAAPAAPATPAAAELAAAAPEPPQEGCPTAPRAPSSPSAPKVLPPPVVADADLPAPLPAGPKASSLDAVVGKGIWVTNWPKTELDVPAVVERTRAAGLRTIWVRTGGSRQGYYGDLVLPQLVPAAHAAGLKVVAWDFPFLSDPLADAARARTALEAGIDGFAPDVETTAEGTYATAQRVELYLSHVRAYAGDRPVAATVPRPTQRRLESFPYSAFGAYSDLFVPMVYWSCTEPGALVEQSLAELGRMLPVAPVGQAYDMGSEGGRHGLPTRAETWRFLDAAKRGGAVGASLWTIEKVSDDQWDALTSYPWDIPPP